MKTLLRWWHELNYRYCKSQEYLALNRHDVLVAVDWSRRASEWKGRIGYG